MQAFIDRDGVLSLYPQDPQEEFALDSWIEKNLFKEDVTYNPGRGPAACPCTGVRDGKLHFEFQPRYPSLADMCVLGQQNVKNPLS